MRVRLLIVVLGAVCLLATGFRPGTLPYNPGATFSDAVTSHLPAAQFLREAVLDQHSFPLWRETIMAGQPFAADPLNKTAYPLQWIALLLPPIYHLDLMIVLHLLIAGAGMWLWARSLGLGEWAAGISALAYALSPRVLGHTGAGHLDLLYALAWFPLLMWAVGRVVQTDHRCRGAARCAPTGCALGRAVRRLDSAGGCSFEPVRLRAGGIIRALRSASFASIAATVALCSRAAVDRWADTFADPAAAWLATLPQSRRDHPRRRRDFLAATRRGGSGCFCRCGVAISRR